MLRYRQYDHIIITSLHLVLSCLHVMVFFYTRFSLHLLSWPNMFLGKDNLSKRTRRCIFSLFAISFVFKYRGDLYIWTMNYLLSFSILKRSNQIVYSGGWIVRVYTHSDELSEKLKMLVHVVQTDYPSPSINAVQHHCL